MNATLRLLKGVLESKAVAKIEVLEPEILGTQYHKQKAKAKEILKDMGGTDEQAQGVIDKASTPDGEAAVNSMVMTILTQSLGMNQAEAKAFINRSKDMTPEELAAAVSGLTGSRVGHTRELPGETVKKIPGVNANEDDFVTDAEVNEAKLKADLDIKKLSDYEKNVAKIFTVGIQSISNIDNMSDGGFKAGEFSVTFKDGSKADFKNGAGIDGHLDTGSDDDALKRNISKIKRCVVKYNDNLFESKIDEGVASAKKAFLDTHKIAQVTFDRLVEIDPSPNKKYIDWMVRTFVKNGLSHADVGHYGVIKDFFELVDKKTIQGKETDINQYKNVEQVYDLVKKFEDVKSSTAEEKEIKAGAEKVFENDKVLIVKPHTREASCLYGKGTKWCTAGDVYNYFNNYYDRNVNLFYILPKGELMKEIGKVAIAVYRDGKKEVYNQMDTRLSPAEANKILHKFGLEGDL